MEELVRLYKESIMRTDKEVERKKIEEEEADAGKETIS